MPLVVGCLPLKKDHEENSTVYKCICQLYQAGHPELFNQLPAILAAVAQVLGTKHLEQGRCILIMSPPLWGRHIGLL